ncbi:MAG: glycosyltransferase family 2 protein [Planctomycetes bacterium]|nr:glycosyltransferase family 2 protein [Planctomycetota bacterium]
MSASGDDNSAYNISVIIPAYNAGDTIAYAIESILAQSVRPSQIIVIDDGSTDNTAQIAQQFQNVTYIHQQNAGVSSARNAGIKSATGNWIAFLDADDLWLDKKLELQINILKNNPDLVWTTGNYFQYLKDKGIKLPLFSPDKAATLLDGKDRFEDYLTAFEKHCRGWTGTMLIRKDVFDKAGLFNAERHLGEDIELWFKIAFEFPAIGFNAEPLAIYNMDTTESLTTKDFSENDYIDFVKELTQTAAEHGRFERFKPIVSEMTSLRIRSLLFKNEPDEIHLLISELGDLLNPAFKLLINLLMICPGLTASVCHLISRVVRKLKLRNPIIPPPKKPKQ